MAGKFKEYVGGDEHFENQMQTFYMSSDNHQNLKNRSAHDSHPMSAISGLDDRFEADEAEIHRITDHRNLTYREQPDAHPMSAITGLDDRFEKHENDIRETVEESIAEIDEKISAVTTYVDDKVGSAKVDIQAKADAALASIPEDYTDLNNKVSELSESIANISDDVYTFTDIPLDSTVTGRNINPEGLAVRNSDANMYCFRVTAGDTIFVNAPKQTDGVYMFQNGTTITGTGTNTRLVGSVGTKAINGLLRVPQNATCIYISVLATETNYSVKLAKSQKEQVENSISYRGQIPSTGVDCNTLTKTGWYGFTSIARGASTNLPSGITSGTLNIVVYTKGFGGDIVTQQIAYAQNGDVYSRVINNSTGTDIVGWKKVGGEQTSVSIPLLDVWKNKKFYCFGDSRTWYDGETYGESTTSQGVVCVGYESWMRTFLGATVVNKGFNGYTSPQIYNELVSTNLSDADAVTLFNGINDWYKNVPIGTISSIGETFDTTTAYGACQAMVESVIARKPKAKLYIINPFNGWRKNGEAYTDTNYPKVWRDIADLYGLPFLDLTVRSGFNKLNTDTFYVDDPNKNSFMLHLNNWGNEVIGKEISTFLLNC